MTLVELVILITIVGVLAFVATMNIDSYFYTKLHACAQKIHADIRYAQYLSIAEHRVYGIEFDSGDNYYRVYDPDTGDLAIDPYTRADLELDLDDSREYEGISITSVNFDSADEVRFTSLGKPLNDSGTDLLSTGVVNLSYRGHSKQVDVYPVTGWVEIQ
ncbi:MAG: hypothetical protein P9M06_01140 [Candidatus Saelkia tenebricola]|nr:hypothetical protein [Candidatus Saelkia tenebricola]